MSLRDKIEESTEIMDFIRGFRGSVLMHPKPKDGCSEAYEDGYSEGRDRLYAAYVLWAQTNHKFLISETALVNLLIRVK